MKVVVFAQGGSLRVIKRTRLEKIVSLNYSDHSDPNDKRSKERLTKVSRGSHIGIDNDN